MRITFDGQDYYLDEEQLTSNMLEKANELFDRKIDVPNGPSIDLRKKSLTMVAMRQLFTMFIPMIEYSAKVLNVDLPKKVKHGDIIDYVLKCYVLILNKSLNLSHLSVETKPYVDDMRIISEHKLEAEKPVPLLGALNGNNDFS